MGYRPKTDLINSCLLLSVVVAVLRPDFYHAMLRWFTRGQMTWPQRISPWQAVLALWVIAGLGLFGIFESHWPPFMVAMVTVIGLFLLVWARELGALMQAGDDAFPGRFDKPLWVLLFLVVPPGGVVLFRWFRGADQVADTAKPRVVDAELA